MFMGGGEGRTDNLIGFVYWFNLFTVGFVAEESLLKAVLHERS